MDQRHAARTAAGAHHLHGFRPLPARGKGARAVLARHLMLALSLFLLGLASGVHCVGMCGGFVAAFSGRKVIVIQSTAKPWRRLLAFNAGRITSYAIAGAAAGVIGGELAALLGARTVLYVLANLM